MRYSQLLLEYDRARAIQALGPTFWLAALRDKLRLWHVPLTKLESDLRSRDSAAVGWFNDTSAQQDLADTYMERIEQADPSGNKKYTQWMARQFAISQGIAKLEDIESTLADYVSKFDKLNRRKQLEAPFNDINRYKSITDFMDKMDEYDDPIDNKSSGTAETVHDGESVKVVIPKDQAAACAYGRQTRWCTAATQGTNYFEQYNRQGPMYILLPKQPTRQGEKYQLHFPSEQFMDEDDDPVSLVMLLEKRFPELLEFFKKLEPESVGEYLVFSTDDMLTPVAEKITTLLIDHLNDMTGDWGADDDYYWQWLRSEGYVDPETDDISDDAPSYFEYNDDARRTYVDIDDAIDLSSNEIRKLADEIGREEDTVLTLDNIEDVYIRSVKDATDRDNGLASTMIDFIKKRLYVYFDTNTKSWDVKLTKPK
jgi:hypothetical protein